MFSVATIFLVAFALNLQDAVYAQNNTTLGNTSSISLSTTSMSMSWSTPNVMITPTSNSSTPNPPAATSTSTSMSTPSTTGTISPISVTTAPPPKKICGVVKATLEGNKPASLQKFLEDFYFNDTKKYTDVKITELEGTDKISFKVCLNFNTTGYFEDDAVKLLKDILSVSNVKVEITGVSEWKAAEGECKKKCSSEGAAGPLNIERECNDKEYSCKGVKTTDEAEGCDKYCPESGAVSFMVSYLLVAMGIALSLSFYL
ncbi:PREDICTED: uncharacterized protein LOC107356460 isoform X2 [Acropora digitifera]|uniref:uncharacterized protein LOC107356460 isoform X2 n=1 Tax=Acropora digitifera TaxID=70779 RepID=UPI00077AD138|nr:PREDICTED: uncharacterized protein LOC107356460 isoform X2 [Acropora digitifera]